MHPSYDLQTKLYLTAIGYSARDSRVGDQEFPLTDETESKGPSMWSRARERITAIFRSLRDMDLEARQTPNADWFLGP